MPPLSGVQVLEVQHTIASAYAGKLLADLGARVVKLDERAGQESVPAAVSRYHDVLRGFLDSGKELNDRADRAELIAQATILITTSPLDALLASGIDPEQLARSGRILVSITSFGLREENPPRLMPDLLASALGGFLLLTGDLDHPPARNQASLPQFQAGIAGVIGALAALLGLEAGGTGDVVDVSLYESTAFLMEREDVVYTHQDQLWQRTARHKVVHPFAIFPCRDGYVGMAVAGPLQFRALAELIDAPELAEDQALLLNTIAYADQIDQKLLPWLAAHDRAEICQLAQERRIPVTPVLSFPEVLTDAHLRSRQFFRTAQIAGEQIAVPGLPYRLSGGVN